jgi:hypothetical protein
MLNKIYLEPDGLVVGGNQLVTSGGGVSVANNMFVGGNIYTGNLVVTSTFIAPSVTTTTSTTSTTSTTTTTSTTSKPAFYSTSTSTLSGTTAANTSGYLFGPMPFNTTVFDTNGCYNNTTSWQTLNGITVPPYCFAPNVPGYYMVTVQNYSAGTASGGGYSKYAVAKNGIPNSLSSTTWSVASYFASPMSLATLYEMANVPLTFPGSNFLLSSSSLIYLNGTSDYVYATVGTSSISLGSVSGQFYAEMVRQYP